MAVLITVSIIATQSCKKAQDGAAGADGNANVTSQTLTVSTWTWDATNLNRYANWTGSVSILTAPAVSTGAVMLYQIVGTQYVQLPITSRTTNSISENDLFTYSVGSLNITIQNSDSSDPIANIITPSNYKLVVIPQKSLDQHPNVNLKNYNEVKRTFNLKD